MIPFFEKHKINKLINTNMRNFIILYYSLQSYNLLKKMLVSSYFIVIARSN